MKITLEVQVTIPAEIRDKLGLLPNMEVEFELIGDVVYSKKANPNLPSREKLMEMMRGKATVKMSLILGC
jgi:AbrB family looped-hinge helix DNA binding protein